MKKMSINSHSEKLLPDSESQITEFTRFLRQLKKDPAMLIGLAIVILLIVVAVFAPLLAHYGSNQSTGVILAKPSFDHPFGTNIQGRDLFSRVIFGSRNSLGVAFPSACQGQP